MMAPRESFGKIATRGGGRQGGGRSRGDEGKLNGNHLRLLCVHNLIEKDICDR